MALFQFELAPVEEIVPWGEPGNLSLSWFALTDGRFTISAGDQTLFEYKDEVVSDLSVRDPRADYQVAAFARDVLGAVSAAVAPLPPLFEALVRDESSLRLLREHEQAGDTSYAAFRWLGERSPWMSYLVANPRFWFARVRDEVWTQWDNVGLEMDGVQPWTATRGVFRLPLNRFVSECEEFAESLLSAMDRRIAQIETREARPQVDVDVASLRQQHGEWKTEFGSYFRQYEPDISWPEAEVAVRKLAGELGVELPSA